MHDFITQRVPGYLVPDDQVALAADIIQSAAELLQFAERDGLERGLAAIRQPLGFLVKAGVLATVTFVLHEEDSVCGVSVAFDPYSMEDFAAVDLTLLRLAASPTGTGSMEIVCVESAIAEAYSQLEWLPPSHPNLAWCQVQYRECVEDHHLLGDE